MEYVMHKQVDSRYQMVQCCLDDTIGLDNPVRILDDLIEYLFRQPEVINPTGRSIRGRRAFSGKDLTKLFIYGYLNGITSSRRLEKETYINRELVWLIREQHPGYKTIANFRKDNGILISMIFSKMLELLQDHKLITGKVWVIDGNKTKANAKRDMDSVVNLKKQIAKLDQSIEETMKQLDGQEDDSQPKGQDNDSGDHDPGSGTSARKEMAEAIQDLEQATEKREQKQKLLDLANSLGKNYITKADPDALLLLTRRGKCAGHNVQYVVDDENHLIVGAQLVDEANDLNSLYKVAKATCERTGIKPRQLLADRGYSNYSDIKKIYEEITEGVYVTLQQTTRKVEGFRYDKELGTVLCPQGRAMRKRGTQKSRGISYQHYYIKGCLSCPLNEKCAANKDGRSYLLSENHEFVDFYRAKMQTSAAMSISSRRKTVVEHVFGTIAQLMNYNGFKLRGKNKVPTEIHLYAIAYNIKRLLKLMRDGDPRGAKSGRLCPNLLHLLIFNFFAVIMTKIRLFLLNFELFWKTLFDNQSLHLNPGHS
jgi:transposase